MTRHGSNVRVLNHLNHTQFSLNASLADILSLCDGSLDLCGLVDVLQSHYSASKFSRADVQSGLDKLSAQGLISFRSDGTSRRVLCVCFQGFDPQLDVLDNYLTYALSSYESVLIVDPELITPDILLILQETKSFSPAIPESLNDSTLTVQVACFGIKADFDNFDFSISSDTAVEDNLRHMYLAIKDSRDPVFSCHRYAQILPVQVRPDYLAHKIAEAMFPTRSGPNAEARKSKLTIGMATYDDYDGVYFTIQSIRLFHPEVLDQVEFLILDNNPEGYAAKSLRDLCSSVPGVRYIPFSGFTGTAVRELLFHYADSDWVLCLDSHVMLAPQALALLLEYIDGLNECNDLLQGPLLDDQLDRVLTHFEPKWHDGMYGTWAADERGQDENAEPFEIEMQGLGLFACHKDAWPGLNPGFRGFGGEEGYLHEKIRRAGGRTLCLPFLRWIHRFSRPSKVPYKITWEDRIRNYLLGYHELGWDIGPLMQHFSELTDPETVQSIERSITLEYYG